ncbi:MAG: sodium:proline symporter [Hahellaceae bacterium]|nr:sodium:proline symporter [Hahellaceae bacterium]MCP5169181.1 sodium:proline symporter [Hahellaceae bacterium]
MIDTTTVVTSMLLYMGLLFGIAQWGESRSPVARKVGRHPLTYSLSLAIYCSSWTFYGLVGMATQTGFLFLTSFIGPCLVMIFAWSVLRRLVLLKEHFRFASLADFLAARYNKSNTVGAMVSLFALLGSIPYMSIQLKAIIESFNLLLKDSPSSELERLLQHNFDLLVVALMAFFAIVFGVRRQDPTLRHRGMVMALAAESIVKLIAFLCVGIFATWILNDGLFDLLNFAQMHQGEVPAFAAMTQQMPMELWIAFFLLATINMLFLPRQFHIAIVENPDVNHLRTTQWVFPLYLFLLTLFVFPVGIAALKLELPTSMADYFLLLLPQAAHHPLLALLVFIGGFSAAMGMTMASTMTLSTMFSNNLLLPVLERMQLNFPIQQHMLRIRWAAVLIILGASYWFYRAVGEFEMIAQIGILAFSATLQFAPAILGGLYWSKGNRFGAIAGISLGFLFWFFTLIIPALIKAHLLPLNLLHEGLFGWQALRPTGLFGTDGLHPVSHAVFWSLLFNCSAYVIGSLLLPASREEQVNAQRFTGVLEIDAPLLLSEVKDIAANTKVTKLHKLFAHYFSRERAERKVSEVLKQCNIRQDDQISIQQLSQLLNATESALAGSIGIAAAHQAIKDSSILTEDEYKALSLSYADVLAKLNISPKELKEKVDFYQAREALMKKSSDELQHQVEMRTTELKVTNDHLLKTLSKLNDTQKHLVEVDKMAALGGLVAGVAHEINTPLGITITATSHLTDTTEQLKSKFASGQLTKTDFTRFFDGSEESLRILRNNTQRAAELIKSFKQVAVDQSSEDRRRFNLQEYLDEVLLSLRPKIKHTPYQFDIECASDIVLDSYPGALSQIITNLVMNSLMHGFEGRDHGHIYIKARSEEDHLLLTYEDDGKGMDEDALAHLFEPFYTSKRGSGGSGLGAHIVYNLVTQKLGGKIDKQSAPDKGLRYTMSIPLRR